MLRRATAPPTILVAAVGASVSLLAFWAAARWEKAQARAHFECLAAERVAELRKAINVELFALTATRAFFDGSERVGRNEFRAFASACLPHLHGTQVIGWVARVPGAE
ncbi:MAG: hypothetical protein ACUVT2_12645, partial [Thiobacillaceae bacterium]